MLSRLTNTNNRAEFSRTARSFIPTWVRSAPAPAEWLQHAVRFSVTAPSYCGNPSKPLPEAAADSCFSSSGSLPASHAARIHSPSASVTYRSADLAIYRPVGLIYAGPPTHSRTALLSSSSSSSSPPAAFPPPPVFLSSNCALGRSSCAGAGLQIQDTDWPEPRGKVSCAPAPPTARNTLLLDFLFFLLNGVLHDGCMLLNSGHPVPKRLSHTHIQTLDCIYKH